MFGMQYMLDLELYPGRLDDRVAKRYKGVWLVFQADGWPETLYSSKVEARKEVGWSLAIRIFPTVPELTNAFLYVTLMGEGKAGPENIGAARISLSKIPVGPPQQITFQLVSIQNNALAMANCTIRATIGAHFMTPRTYPQLPGFRGNCPPPGAMSQR